MDTTDMLNIADVLVWNTGIFHIAIYAVVMSAIVFVHELGHYSVGRLLGAKIETFSIGLGRELAHRTDARGTRWRIAIFPIGGYVRFAARTDPAQDADDPLRADLGGSGILPEFRNPFRTQTAVANTDIYLRPLPNTDNDPIGLVTKNSKVRIVNSQNNWYQVDVIEQRSDPPVRLNATRGWLNGKYIDIDD